MLGRSTNLIHERRQLSHFAGVLLRKIDLFRLIFFNVKKLGTWICILVGIVENQLPVALENSALPSPFKKFPIELLVLLLLAFPEESRNQGISVRICLLLGA